MVLSPQAFHNLNPYADLFNHSNIHFWEYMQPGYDALGFISCTGTNYLMRAQAFMEASDPPEAWARWTYTHGWFLTIWMPAEIYGLAST